MGLTFWGLPLYQNNTSYKQIGMLFKANYKLINSEEVSQVQSHWNKTIQFICPESFPNCWLINIGFIYNPKHVKLIGIPYGQALRIRRICNSDEVFERRLSELLEDFVKRGFKKNVIDSQFQRAKERSKDSLLSQEKWERLIIEWLIGS